MSEATGKAVGGVARAKALTAPERRVIARKAAEARWETLPSVICGSPDRPLRINGVEIPCFVLEGGTRVLSQAGLLEALGRHPKASVKPQDLQEGAAPAPPPLQAKALRPYIPADLLESSRPITFRLPGGGRATGYRAETLPQICEIYLRARDDGVLTASQRDIAKRADILIRGLAHVGIIALVDEATGYQEVRACDALARILEDFIAKELQPWLRTFPTDFYRELFRLRGLEWPGDSVKRPQYFGWITNDLVYSRLAPGVLEELRRIAERDERGRPKHKYFQRLTDTVGYPKLREHLGAVVAVMRLSPTWPQFMAQLDKFYPRYGSTLPLPFQDDEGTGL